MSSKFVVTVLLRFNKNIFRFCSNSAFNDVLKVVVEIICKKKIKIFSGKVLKILSSEVVVTVSKNSFKACRQSL